MRLREHTCNVNLNFKGPRARTIRGREDLTQKHSLCVLGAHISQKILSSVAKFPERVEIFWMPAPVWQDRTFPQYFLICLSFLSFFLQLSSLFSSFWSPGWADCPPGICPPGKALVTPLLSHDLV